MSKHVSVGFSGLGNINAILARISAYCRYVSAGRVAFSAEFSLIKLYISSHKTNTNTILHSFQSIFIQHNF